MGGKFEQIYQALIGKTNIYSTMIMAMRDGELKWSEAFDIGQAIFAVIMTFTPYGNLWSTIDLVLSSAKLM